MLGSTWIARRSLGARGAYIWTVSGVTAAGIYITCPHSRSPGHLITPADFKRDFVPA